MFKSFLATIFYLFIIVVGFFCFLLSTHYYRLWIKDLPREILKDYEIKKVSSYHVKALVLGSSKIASLFDNNKKQYPIMVMPIAWGAPAIEFLESLKSYLLTHKALPLIFLDYFYMTFQDKYSHFVNKPNLRSWFAYFDKESLPYLFNYFLHERRMGIFTTLKGFLYPEESLSYSLKYLDRKVYFRHPPKLDLNNPIEMPYWNLVLSEIRELAPHSKIVLMNRPTYNSFIDCKRLKDKNYVEDALKNNPFTAFAYKAKKEGLIDDYLPLERLVPPETYCDLSFYTDAHHIRINSLYAKNVRMQIRKYVFDHLVENK